MKILVTGGLGFIGSNFIHHILSKHSEHTIINVDKIGVGANPENLKDIENEKRYKFIKGDLLNLKLVNKVVKDVDVIVNMAAETHVDRSIKDSTTFVQNNTIGTFNLLEAVRAHNNGAKFVQVSTDEVYGETIRESFKENSMLKPSNPYSASKAAADMFVLAYHKTHQLNTIITRCTNNFGPYQFAEKLIPKTIIRALKNLPVPIYGSGKNVRDWIYVLDHCEAINVVIEKGKPGEIYNVSAGNEKPNLEIVRKILQILEKPEELITFVEDRPGHDLRYSLDSSKIRYNLGWKPKFRFEEALAATVNWYKENEWWWKPLATTEVLHPTPWRMGCTQ